MSYITIYKDDSANSIFIGNSNGAQFLNSLRATVTDAKITITDLAKNINLVSNIDPTFFLDRNGNSYPGTATDVCNALNAIFQSSGTPTSDPPVITSPLAISSVQGSVINYELISDFGVGYEWDLSNVPGVTTVEGNVRKILGGSSLAPGTYNIPVKAINYNGEDFKTIVLTVSNPPFSNTKSVKFNNLDFLSADAVILENILGRSSNGSGASDAWSISMWVKPAGPQNNQTLFYYGGDDNNNEGHIWFRYYGNSSSESVMLEYGTKTSNLKMLMPPQSIPRNQWTHLLVVYDGGTTGGSGGNVSNYYSRFKFYTDGVLKSTSNTNQGSGYSGSIKPEIFQIGKKGTKTSHIKGGGKLEEISAWGSEQSSNASSIYNSGVPFSLLNLGTPPEHWWRCGDGDTYPFLQDSGTEANCVFVMNNMTAADLVNDVP